MTDLLINGVVIGVLIALVALGFALTFSILKFINFAHTDLITVGGYLAYICGRIKLSVVLSVIVATVLTGLLGVLIERLAYRPLRGQRLSMFLSSFGVSIVLNASVALCFGSTSRTLPIAQNAVRIGGRTLAAAEVIALCLFLVLLPLSWFIFRKTRYGLAARAISENWDGVALLGIPCDRLVSCVFFVSSGLAALAGILLGSLYSLSPQMGHKYGIWAFVLVVVAGFGSILGIATTGLFAGLAITAVLYFFGSYTFVNAVLFGILTIVLLVRPDGLFGMRLRRF